MEEDPIASFFDALLRDADEKNIVKLISADKDDEEIIEVLLRKEK